jgi:hypothetical protein
VQVKTRIARNPLHRIRLRGRPDVHWTPSAWKRGDVCLEALFERNPLSVRRG